MGAVIYLRYMSGFRGQLCVWIEPVHKNCVAVRGGILAGISSFDCDLRSLNGSHMFPGVPRRVVSRLRHGVQERFDAKMLC